MLGSRCRLAGPLPAPSPHSDRPGFDQLGRSALVCRLTGAGALLLHERRPRPTWASGTCASMMPNNPGHVPRMFACGRKRPLMPRPSLSCPARFQSPCAHRWVRRWLQDILRDRERRSGRVLCILAASIARLHGLETLGIYGGVLAVPFDHRGELLGVDIVVDQCGVQRVVERRDLAKRGLWRVGLCPRSTLCWYQVDWKP